jgi:hypothetical protein
MNNGLIVDGLHRANALMSLNEGTVPCRVVDEVVSANLIDNEWSELRTDQDDFLPTTNKLYQRVYKFD